MEYIRAIVDKHIVCAPFAVIDQMRSLCFKVNNYTSKCYGIVPIHEASRLIHINALLLLRVRLCEFNLVVVVKAIIFDTFDLAV